MVTQKSNQGGRPSHSFISLEEASRKDLLTRSRRDSPKRYAKRVNYFVSNFKGVDLAQLFENDYFVFSTPIKDYICTLAFPGVLTKLKETVKGTDGNPRRVNLRMVIQALREAFDATDDVKVRCTCPDFCLTGDTEIKLLEGKSIKMEDLLKEFESGRQDLWAYSVDEITHDFRPGHISDVWISGYSDEFIEVTLDNDKVIKTTPNHLYMLRDGTYKRADELVIGQSLMPLYFPTELIDYNHSITSIRRVHLSEKIPVYDLTVEKYNNFLVSAGVILHNCYRFMYYAWKYDYLYGAPTPGTEEPPNITNPDDSIGATCKHLDLFLANKRWLTKAASTVNALIRTYPDKAAVYLYDDQPTSEEDDVEEVETDEVEVEETPTEDETEIEETSEEETAEVEEKGEED